MIYMFYGHYNILFIRICQWIRLCKKIMACYSLNLYQTTRQTGGAGISRAAKQRRFQDHDCQRDRMLRFMAGKGMRSSDGWMTKTGQLGRSEGRVHAGQTVKAKTETNKKRDILTDIPKWKVQGSNLRPFARQASALPAELTFHTRDYYSRYF